MRKDVADEVAKHLVAAGTLLEEDPARALAHARYARSKASRLAVVREAAGLAAYRAGEWNEAIGELRAARRMGGGPGHLAILADAERALGRPEKALEVARGPEARELDRPDAIELLIVAAGARRDLGEVDAAVVSLQIPELDPSVIAPWSARLFYAYADLLLAAGRRDESIRWFLHAAQADDEESTDAAERLAELADPDGSDSADADPDGSESTDADPDGSESAEVDPDSVESGVSGESDSGPDDSSPASAAQSVEIEGAVPGSAGVEGAGPESAEIESAGPESAEVPVREIREAPDPVPTEITVPGDVTEPAGDPAR